MALANNIVRNQCNGFSLVEMTLVLLVLSVLSASGLSLWQEKDARTKIKETNRRLDVVEKAMYDFRFAKNRLPCPSDIRLQDNTENFGKEAQVSGDCDSGSPQATARIGDVAYGGVPTRALNLPDEYMYDAWQRRFSFYVDVRLTETNALFGYAPGDGCIGNIRVNDAADSPRTERAIYALISHGESGHGAYLSSGNRRNINSDNPAEMANAAVDASFAEDYSLPLVMRRHTEGATMTERYDDILRYKERWAITTKADQFVVPVGPGGEDYFVEISAGYSHTCGVTNRGSGYCWGWNSDGQLGNNSTDRATSPEPVDLASGESGYVMISAGNAHTCGLGETGNVYCWGKGMEGQLGIGSAGVGGSLVPLLVPLPSGVTRFTSVGVGAQHSCAIADTGDAYCWGWNGYGQLGDNTVVTNQNPVRVQGAGVNFVEISASRTHTCAISDADEAYCWGNNSHGQLGDNSTTQRNAPVKVNNRSGLLTEFRSISANGILHDNTNASCSITNDGAYCWGSNAFAQLGTGSHTSSNVPVKVNLPSGSAYTSIAMGGNGFACGVIDVGAAYCWGDNAGYGQIGNGSMLGNSAVTSVTMPSGVTGYTAIETGDEHICAISTDDRLFCWGAGHEGQLGDGGTDHRGVPTASGGNSLSGC